MNRFQVLRPYHAVDLCGGPDKVAEMTGREKHLAWGLIRYHTSPPLSHQLNVMSNERRRVAAATTQVTSPSKMFALRLS